MLAVAGAAFLLGLMVGVGGVSAVVAARTAGGAAPPVVQRMTRDEFRAAVEGKTPEEVIQAVGKPDSTMEISKTQQRWFYSKKAIDTVTGRQADASVFFTRGVATDVSF